MFVLEFELLKLEYYPRSSQMKEGILVTMHFILQEQEKALFELCSSQNA
jgi:hypothetical protein